MTKTTNITRKVLLLAGLLSIFSCTTSKSLMKDGLEYEQAGMYSEALRAYKASLQRNMTNLQSREGLKKVAQHITDQKLSEFSRASIKGDLRAAVDHFHKVEKFEKELKRYSVDVYVPEHYFQTYSQLEDNLIDDLYEEGLSLLEEEDFSAASTRFEQILALNPNHEDVQELYNTSTLEPEYRKAQNFMDAGDYRDAYWVYSKILRQDEHYKESRERLAVAKELGTFVIAMLPFESHQGEQLSAKMEAYVMNEMSRSNNPFIKIVDRQHLDQIMAEQNFSLSGVINDASAMEVGNLTGAQAIMVGQVIDLRRSPGRLRKSKANGYESYKVKVTNDEGKEVTRTRYRPVSYYEYGNSNSVFVSFHLKLLDLETSEVLISEVFEKELVDQVEWIEYGGDLRRLFPALDSGPQTKRSYVNALRAKADERKELVSITELETQCLNRISTSVAQRIDAFVR